MYIQTRKETLLNAVKATTTSNGVGVANAGRVSLQLVGANLTAGSALFTMEVSNDGTNWSAYNRMVANVTNTNAQNDTKISSVLINTNASSMIFVPAGDTFAYLRVKATVQTDGEYTATAFID